MTTIGNTEDPKLVDWSKLYHIGAHQRQVERPDCEELGIDEVHRICDRIWIYSRADFEPDFSVERRSSQWRETCALAGSIGESLMLSAATYVEAVWHSRALTAEAEPAGMAIAQRYLADTAVDTVISVGHRLINFVVRVARTTPTNRARLGDSKHFKDLGASYTPFDTEERNAWLSLNAPTVDALRDTLLPIHSNSLNILAGLVRSDGWTRAWDIRAENFHRWRKEHESVVGVDRHSGHAVDKYDADGNLVGRAFGARPRPHTISAGLTEGTTEAAGDAIRLVAKAVEGILDDTLNILPQLTDNRYALEISYDGKRKRAWPLGKPRA